MNEGPASTTARLNCAPADTCEAPVRPATWTGPDVPPVAPSPSWPWALPPQASAVPFDLSASTWSYPAESWVIPLPVVVICTGRVTGLLVGALSSWPDPSAPQAQDEPSVPRTTANWWPAEMPAMYGVGIPTCSGVRWLVKVPSPSWPMPLPPQAHTDVSAVMPLVVVASDAS